MSDKTVAELPDPICSQGLVSTERSARSRTIRAQVSGNLISVNIGPSYIAMSLANWRALFSAIESLEAPQRTFRLVVNDAEGTAQMEPVQ